MNPKKAILPPLAALTAAAFLAGGTLAFSASGPNENGAKANLQLQVDNSPLNRDVKLGNSFAPIVKSVTPSVVKVFVTTGGQHQQMSGADMEQFRKFFGPMFPDFDQQQQNPNQHALGSGVVMSQNGYILTNNHVIENAKEIQVALNDGRSFTAKLIGTDPQTDVALLKIEANNLPAVTMADKPNRSVGALVSEVSPNGPAEAAGLKSGDVVLQYDNKPVDNSMQLKLRVAETSPGANVPLQIDRNGETKTVSVVVKERSGATVAQNDAPKSSDQGSLNGVTVGDLNQELRTQLKVANTVQGAVIEEVDPSSASAEAGLKVGDIITEIDHRSIKSAQEAVEATSGKPNGATLVKIYRNGGSRYVAVNEGSE